VAGSWGPSVTRDVDGITTGLALAVAAVVGYVFNTLTAQRLGLGGVQVAVRAETTILIGQLKARVDLLSAENIELKAKVEALVVENRAQAVRIDHLETALADRAIERSAK
jgi:hypothetical protein